MIELPSALYSRQGPGRLTKSYVISPSKVSLPNDLDHLHVIYHFYLISLNRTQSIGTHVYPATDVRNPSRNIPEHACSTYKLSSSTLLLEQG